MTEAPETLPLLEASHVTVRIEGQTLVADVSMSVERGTIHALVGPNGAGKSTLVSAILGQIGFTGRVTCHFRGAGLIGFVPQSFAVDRTLPVTVEELLALSRQRLPICFGVRASTRAHVRGMLDRVGLASLATRRLGALSGGELRRVLFANAIDPIPELLILDEPGSGLDEESAKRLEDALSALRASSDVTVLMVSHDAAQVQRLADRITELGPKGATTRATAEEERA